MSGVLLEEDQEPDRPGAPDPMGDQDWAARVTCDEGPVFPDPGDEIVPSDWIPAGALAALMAQAREVSLEEARARAS